MASGKTTRESSCNALPMAFHDSSHFVSNHDTASKDSIMDKIMADRFSLTLVLLCIFAAFIANIIHSAQKVLPSDQCSLALASIIGPVEKYQCPFPILNSVLRISISCYLFLLLIVLIIAFKSYSRDSCPTHFSMAKCIPWTVGVLSISHYLCFISIVMDCYVVYTAFKFTRYHLERQDHKLTIDMRGDSMGNDASKEFTIIITNFLSFLGCSIMKFMVISWFKKINVHHENSGSVVLYSTKMDGEHHPSGVVTPLDVEVRGSRKSMNLEHFEKKLNTMMDKKYDYHHNSSSSNSSVSSRECSITRSHTADNVTIINVIPSKEPDPEDPVSDSTITNTKDGGQCTSCSFRDHGYVEDDEESPETKSMKGSILMALEEKAINED